MKLIDILGFDPGYSDIKESYRNENGEIINRKYSSLVAEASADATDMPLLEGKRYYMGEEALVRGSEEIIELTDYMQLEKTIPLFLYKSIKDNNIDPNQLKYIVSGLSFAQISKGPDFIKRLSKFKINNETFNFSKRVLLAPQAVGAKYAIEYFFPEGPKTYLIIDIGFSTIDIVDVINSVVRRENVHGYKDEGIIRIARNLQNYIAEKFSENVSLKEVKEILETKTFFLEGEDYDLSDKIEEFSKIYTESTIKTLQERFSREFKKYRKIYFVGGGAYFIDSSISKVIEILPEPEFYNSIGNLLRGEQELQK